MILGIRPQIYFIQIFSKKLNLKRDIAFCTTVLHTGLVDSEIKKGIIFCLFNYMPPLSKIVMDWTDYLLVIGKMRLNL